MLINKSIQNKTEKIQFEFAEIVVAKNRPVSAMTVLNSSDNRFSSGARFSWSIAEPLDASEVFGVNFGDDGDWEMGVKANQQKYADDIGVDVIKTQAKRAGKDGDYILHQGQHIFMNSYVDLLPEGSNPESIFLSSDTERGPVKANTGVKADEVEVMM